MIRQHAEVIVCFCTRSLDTFQSQQFRKLSGRRQSPEFVTEKSLQDLALLCKMGRGKLAMQLITKEKERTATYQKRKKSLFKKASELSILCDVDVCVIVNEFQNTDPLKVESESWPENSDEVARIIANYEAKSSGGRCKTASNLSTFFLARQRKAKNKAQSVDKMAIKAKFPDWDNRLNCFSSQQLFELLQVIDGKIAAVDQQLNNLQMMQSRQFSFVDHDSGPEQLINHTSSFQAASGNSGFDWVSTESNLGVFDNEMLHLQMQPQMEFPSQLIEYHPTAITSLQTWPPPQLPHPSLPRMPFLLPPYHTPWPDFINGGHYQMMNTKKDDEYREKLSTMNGFCNFRGI